MSERFRPSPALVVACLALFVALGGTGLAASYVISSNRQIGPGTVSGHKPPSGDHSNIIVGSITARDTSAASIQDRVSGVCPSGMAVTSITQTGGVSCSFTSGGSPGGAAAGDLTGSYPSPTIAAGAVGPSKLGQMPAARAELSGASQALASSVSTPIVFDSDRFDIGGLHDTAVNPSRMTAPIAGLYEIEGGIDWATNANGERTTAIVVNGSTTIAHQRDSADTVSRDAQNVSTLYALSAGDYVELVGTQSSGGSLDVVNFPTTYLAMRWVAPGP